MSRSPQRWRREKSVGVARHAAFDLGWSAGEERVAVGVYAVLPDDIREAHLLSSALEFTQRAYPDLADRTVWRRRWKRDVGLGIQTMDFVRKLMEVYSIRQVVSMRLLVDEIFDWFRADLPDWSE